MAKKKNYYYVLVFTNNGPVYVTSINYSNKYANWNKLEKPLEMTKTSAEDLCFGLMCNFYSAVVVSSPVELEYQPYLYDEFELVAKEINKEEN